MLDAFRLIRVVLTLGISALFAGMYSIEEDEERRHLHPAPRAVMRIVIGPAADAIFRSVSVTQTAEGEVEEGPADSKAWAALEAQAATLDEGAAMLIVPREAEAPEWLSRLDREQWNRYALALREAAGWALDAAKRQSAPRLISAGGDISLACERCHLAFATPGGRRYLPAEETEPPSGP